MIGAARGSGTALAGGSRDANGQRTQPDQQREEHDGGEHERNLVPERGADPSGNLGLNLLDIWRTEGDRLARHAESEGDRRSDAARPAVAPLFLSQTAVTPLKTTEAGDDNEACGADRIAHARAGARRV